MSSWVKSYAPTLIYFAVTCGLLLFAFIARFFKKESLHRLGGLARFAPLIYCGFVFALVILVRFAFDPPKGLCNSFEGYTKLDIYADSPDPRIEGDVVDAVLTKAMDAEHEKRQPGWEARATRLAGERDARRHAVEASTRVLNCGNYVEWEALVGLESAIALSIWFGAVWFWKGFSTEDFWPSPKRAPLACIVGMLCVGVGWGAAYRFLDETSWKRSSS